MALIFSEDLEAGSNGTTITTANTNFTLVSGTGTSTFTNSQFVEGLLSMQVNTTGAAGTRIHEADITAATTLWLGFYIYPITYPAANTAVSNWWGTTGTVKIGDFRMGTTGTLQLRDNNTNVGSASHALTQNQWHRVAVKIIAGSATGHRLKVYSGGDLHGATATFDSGDQTATASAQSSCDNVRVGVMSSTTVNVGWDRIRADDAVETDALTVTGGKIPRIRKSGRVPIFAAATY